MASKNVQLPDGRIVAFPDSMSDDAISAVIQKELGPPAKPSAASRFASSAADSSGLSMAGHAIAHPIEMVSNVAEALNPNTSTENFDKNPIVQGTRGAVGNTVDNARQAWKDARSGNTAGAITHGISAIPIVGPTIDKEEDQYSKGDYAGELGTLAGAVGGMLAPEAVKGVAPVAADYLRTKATGLPAAADDAATGIINKTIGARAADFKRGANPGRGYVQSRLGASRSMESIADKAGEELDSVGQQLRDAHQQATAAGKKIPVDKVRKEVDSIIDGAKNSVQGPGVLSDPDVYDDLRSTFEPSFQSADKNGGFTPTELWDIKKNIADNLNWGDQSKLNLTRTQQRLTGSIGEILKDEIPEVRGLSQRYQDLVKLSDRAEGRALTHSEPLSGMASKAALATAGALAGDATKIGSAAGAVAGGTLKSVPLSTARAAWTSAAGMAATPAINATEKLATSVAPATAIPAALSSVAGDNVVNGVGNPDDNQGSNGTGNNVEDHSEGSIPPQPTIQDKEVVPAQPDKGVQPITLPVEVPAPQPVAEVTTPETHFFSPSQYQQASPGADIEAAKQAAAEEGYEIGE